MKNDIKQTDIFSVFGIEDEYAKRQEEERKKREKQQQEIIEKQKKAALNKGDLPSQKESFKLECNTLIYFYNEEFKILDFFTEEEIELGIPSEKEGEIKYKAISEADIKRRLAKEIPVLQVGVELIHKTYKNKPNILVVTIKAKKKGNANNETEPISSVSPFRRKIPFRILQDFIGISKHFSERFGTEVHGDIYFDTKKEVFCLHIPPQQAHAVWVQSIESDEELALRMIENRNEIKIMEIHSHHTMNPIPSSQDNESEVLPILYTIIGRVDQFFPQITMRTYDITTQSHIPIDPLSIFENPLYQCPSYDLDGVEVIGC